MKSEMNFTLDLDDAKKTSESIYEKLREMILDGTLEPGSRLPSERKLTEMLQRSRSAIREALQMLERGGYIRKIPKSSGAIVQLPGVEPVVESLGTVLTTGQLQISEIMEFRHLTETTGARLAAKRRTTEQLQELKNILESTKTAMGNAKRFAECDLLFHTAIAKCSGNRLFVMMLDVCRGVQDEKLNSTFEHGSEEEQQLRYEQIYDSHFSIYEAICQQNGDAAYQAMETHIQNAEHEMLFY